MRIQHNIMAMNAYRNYTNNVSAMKKNLERLSSGYKINRAGDDAAGLAISEKMRAQITGLETAQKNAKDGISLVQTAEGALQEVHDMLNRMVELATQSANGTYDNDTDRAQLQKEVDQLMTEINRIADSANFNGIQLLDGSMAVNAAVSASSTTVDFSGMDRIITSILGKGETASVMAGKKTILDDLADATAAVKASFGIDFGTLEFQIGASASSISVNITINGTVFSVTATGITSSKDVAKQIAAAFKKAAGSGAFGVGISKGTNVIINGVEWKVSAVGSKVEFTQVYDPKTQDEARANFDVNVSLAGGGSVSIINPVNQKATNSVSMSAAVSGGTYVKTAGVSVADINKANTVFNIRDSDIKDGTQIALGNTLIVLKVGNSAINSTASAAIKAAATKAGMSVVKFVDINEGDNLFTALSKISEEVGTTVKLTVATKNGGTSKIEFRLGVNDGSNGQVVGLTIQRVSMAKSSLGNAFDLQQLADNFAMRVTTKTEARDATTGLTLQIGDTAESFNQLTVNIQDCHTNAIGISDISIADQESAAAAVDAIRAAINYVSDVRGTLGATQNRLEHTINNLSVMTENIQDAESTIRDVDIAEEMMAYTKNNILIQSAQAMLAQANQIPQGVLQLLQ